MSASALLASASLTWLAAPGHARAGEPSPTTAADDKSEGCAAAGLAADRLERAGKLREARAGYAACLTPSCADAIKAECQRRLAAIDAALPAVLLEARDEASNSVSAVRVSMDGHPLVDRLDGVPIAVDPGEHRFTFEAPGFRGIESTIVAREHNKRIRVVAFLSHAGTPEAAAGVAIASPAESDTPVIGARSEVAAGWRRKLALGLGGAGVASLAVGAIWALRSKSTYDHALSSECDGVMNRCSPQGVVDGRTAHQQATVATVGFAAAGVLLASAAALYFTASTPASAATTSVALAPSYGGSLADGRGGSLTVVGKW